MTQQQLVKTVQSYWKQYYWDMGIYRWVNRNLGRLKNVFVATFVITLILAFLNIIAPLVVSASVFVVLVWLSGIDHFIIGRRITRILSELQKDGIVLTRVGLMHYCKDILPR